MKFQNKQARVLRGSGLFCKGEHYFDLRYSPPQLVKQEFDKQKIKIPFPHRVVMMEK